MRRRTVLAALAAGALLTGTDAAYGETSSNGSGLSRLPWSSGVYNRNDTGVVATFEQGRGAAADHLMLFPSRESWDAMTNLWFLDDKRIPVGYRGNVELAVPLWPQDGSLTQAANEDVGARWSALASAVAARYPNAIYRLGWEMNVPGQYWSAPLGREEEWRRAFARAAEAIRVAAPGATIAFVANEGPGVGGTVVDARTVYPGDEYVDHVGIDAYDWWTPYRTAEQVRRDHITSPYGWDTWYDFAVSHGKTFCVPEWGVVTGSDDGSITGGDNPYYISVVLDYLYARRDHVAYEGYFDDAALAGSPEFRMFEGVHPAASAQYRASILSYVGK